MFSAGLACGRASAMMRGARAAAAILALGVPLALIGCDGAQTPPPADSPALAAAADAADYLIGPDDKLQIFVWRNPELSTSVPVRPDGKISIPLIEDLQAAGRKPTDLARGIEDKLKQFVENPIVTVVVESFVGVYGQQVKVVGEAAQPKAVPYRAGMTVLDLMIDVGGLTKFAAGNRAVLTRKTTDGVKTYTVKLDDLLKDGELKRNVPLMPGDTLIIPQSWF